MLGLSTVVLPGLGVGDVGEDWSAHVSSSLHWLWSSQYWADSDAKQRIRRILEFFTSTEQGAWEHTEHKGEKINDENTSD